MREGEREFMYIMHGFFIFSLLMHSVSISPVYSLFESHSACVFGWQYVQYCVQQWLCARTGLRLQVYAIIHAASPEFAGVCLALYV